MHEEQLGRPVLCVVRGLLRSDRIEVPDVDASVGSARSEVDGRVRGPSELEDFVGVRLERVELGAQLANVPKADGLQGSDQHEHTQPGEPQRARSYWQYTYPVSRTSEDKVLAAWRKCHGVDSTLVRLDLGARLARVLAARVPTGRFSRNPLDQTTCHSQHEHLVVADRSEHVIVLGVPVDVLGASAEVGLTTRYGLTPTYAEWPVYFLSGCKDGSDFWYALISLWFEVSPATCRHLRRGMLTNAPPSRPRSH